jgi:flagellar hook assembly protein FlgD
VTAVAGDLPGAGPRLLSAAPNPFNPRTEIKLSLPADGKATVTVYDPRGRRVARLHDGPLAAGEHRLSFDGRGLAGQALPAGLYLVRLRTAEGVDHLRISLVK